MDKCMAVELLCVELNCVVAAWLQCHHVGLYDMKSIWFVLAARVLSTTWIMFCFHFSNDETCCMNLFFEY